MSLVPDTTGIHHVARPMWETVRYALDDTPRTIRLCVILLTIGIATIAPSLIVALICGWVG